MKRKGEGALTYARRSLHDDIANVHIPFQGQYFKESEQRTKDIVKVEIIGIGPDRQRTFMETNNSSWQTPIPQLLINTYQTRGTKMDGIRTPRFSNFIRVT